MIVRRHTGPMPHVWSRDNALDKSDAPYFMEAWKKFTSSGDIKDLPLKSNRDPTVFMLAPLSRRAFLRAAQIAQGPDAHYERVACSLREVRNYRLPGGQLATLDFVDYEGGKRVTEATLDAIYDPFLFSELDARVIDLSTIDPSYGQD